MKRMKWLNVIFILLLTGCESGRISSNQQNTQSPPIQQGNSVNACQVALGKMGQFSDQEGKVDYKSGERIFPLLSFIMTKHSITTTDSQQSVYMKDNPIFVTRNEKYPNTLLFAPIHSKRTGVLHGGVGFPENEVTKYYEPMVFVSEIDGKRVEPSTDIANKTVEVNRETWTNELAKYTEACNDSLILPPTKQAEPFFEYNGWTYPFSKEIDFVAGVDGVGLGLEEYGFHYPDEDKIQIPILIYSPQSTVDNVVMIQDGAELKFTRDKYNSDWQKFLGEDWHSFTSVEVDFDKEAFANADFDKIHSALPPFISDNPSTIQATINGEKVTFVNQ